MSPSHRRARSPSLRPPLDRFRRPFTVVAIGILACSREPRPTQPNLVRVNAIVVDGGPQTLERGTRDTLTATAIDADGDTVAIPVVWRSSNEQVAVFQRGGILVALTQGTTAVTATSLGVQSAPVNFQVVWTGPAKIVAGAWTPPNARSPGVTLTDSIRVVVTNVANAPVANAKVAFVVTDGAGSISPATATTNQAGIAAAQWTLGPAVGMNIVVASVRRADGTPDSLVTDNAVTFKIRSYDALTVQAGNDQSALILSDLPNAPAVKLVDSLGVPRAGVPITFTAFANGRVATPVVSTGADGVASPGKWTLGDIPGTQKLEARVEDAKVSLSATGTGTPVYYKPAAVIAGGFSTCALESNGVVKCWGQVPQIGIGDTANVSVPTTVKGSMVAASVTGGGVLHFCALTSAGLAWCWGANALIDTTGSTTGTFVPTRLQSDIAWAQISAGMSHNCAITLLEIAYCWGFNSGANGGVVGDGSTTNRFVPTPVTGGFKFSRVASGTDHTCALRTNGAALCWGQNQAGQIGDGTTQPHSSPTAVVGGLTFESLGAGAGFSCGLTPQPEGKVYCWGNSTGLPQLTPTTYSGAPAFVSLTVGGGHACALASDASAYCWGGNLYGQLGDSSRTTRTSPTKVAGDLRFTQISAGLVHTCGLTTAGAVACWGRNLAGELGDTTSQFRTTPRHVVLGVNP